MNFTVYCCWAVVLVTTLSASAAAEEPTVLFDFKEQGDEKAWQIVNDGVMGGRSASQVEIIEAESADGAMQFTGNLSLENNGGFASVRSRPSGSLGLQAGQVVVLRVLGDGRRYTFNLYTPTRRTAFSYQLDFQTKAGQWQEVKLPVDNFVAHSFGRRVPDNKLSPSQVHAVGILLGDKKAGPFRMLVDWIQVR